jgi:hypothetical protein
MARRPNDNQVLYIEGIGQLLPLDAERKGRSTPLEWGKLRSPADCSERGVIYNMRIQEVKTRREGWAFLGIYYTLLATFGFGRIAPLRGWLVNHMFLAAGGPYIGQVIGCADLRLLARALRALEDVGLLARVERPDLADAVAHDRTVRIGPAPTPKTLAGQLGTPQHPGPRAPENKPTTPTTAAPTTPHAGEEAAAEGQAQGAKAGGQDNHARTAEAAGDSGQWPDAGRPAAGPPPADVRRETSRQGDGQTPKAASAAPSPLSAHGYGETGEKQETATAAPAPADAPTGDAPQDTAQPGRAGPGDDPRPDGQAADLPTGDGQVSQAGQTSHPTGADPQAPGGPQGTSAAPPPAEPIKPTEADPGQAAAVSRPRRQPADMGWHCEAFAEQVLNVLYQTRDDLVSQGRRCTPPQAPDEFRQREMGCLARCFERGLVGLDQIGAMRLIERSLKEARATHRKRAKTTRGRLWVYWFNHHVRTLGRSGPP